MARVKAPPLFKKGDRVKVVNPGPSVEHLRDHEGVVEKVMGPTSRDASWVKIEGAEKWPVLFWHEELQRVQ